MKIINCTPHEINFYKDGKMIEAFPPSGTVLRVDANTYTVPERDVVSDKGTHIPIIGIEYMGVIGDLPPMEPDTIYIVSKITAEAISATVYRDDFVFIGETVRDDNGRIIGCTSFATMEWYDWF